VDVNDFSRNRLDLETHQVRIRDAREAPGATTLDREGFVLVRQRLPDIDFRDHQQIVDRYLPQMQALIEEVTGADKVVMSDGPITRFSSPLEKGVVRPAGFAHTDYTAKSARDLMLLSFDRRLGPEAGYAETRSLLADSVDPPPGQEPAYRRVLAVQTWRVLSHPPHDMPLALCAADSVSGEDIVEASFGASFSDFSEDQLEFSLYRFNPRHRWSCFADMEPDEVLVFVGYDFRNYDRSRVLHTAFRDPACPADAIGRSSVEARSFALFRD
jgi:hypothetical protein